MMKLTTELLMRVCLTVAGWEYTDADELNKAAKVCVQVAQEAQTQGQPVAHLIALSWAESRFQDGISERRKRRSRRMSDKAWQRHKRWRVAQGPLQVVPWWHCQEHRKKDDVENCDLIRAGVTAFKKFAQYTKNHEETTCYYNCFHPIMVKDKKRVKRPCSPSSRKWARGVSRDAIRVQTLISQERFGS